MYVLNSKQMQAKQYLKQAFRYNELIKASIEELENLRTISTSIASADPSKERISGSKNSEPVFVNAVAKIIDLEKQVDEDMVKFLGLKQEIREIINQVKNVNGILVLRYRYLDFMTWECVADKIGYSIKSVHRMHLAALDDVANALIAKGIAA